MGGWGDEGAARIPVQYTSHDKWARRQECRVWRFCNYLYRIHPMISPKERGRNVGYGEEPVITCTEYIP